MKSKWMKGISLILCFVLVFGLTACGAKVETGENQETTEVSLYKAGTYTATAKGNNGDIKVEVVFDANAIVSVKVLEHAESAGVSDAPIERIAKEVVEKQSLTIDTVAGATMTSEALLAAIEDCVVQAGGDVSLLKTASSGDDKGTETIIDTDVVVVGAGGTGLAAAASAFEQGAKVVVLEKLAATGGSTALSGGGISATGTKFQVEKGITDTKDSWMTLWKERQSTSNPDGMYPNYDFVDYFMDEAIYTTEWLVDYVGHEYVAIMGFGLDPVERLHFAFSDKTTKGGTSLTQNIEKFLVENNVPIYTETKALELMTNASGDVVGVIAENKEGKVIVNAKKVIMATGGFAQSPELLERFIPEVAKSNPLSIASVGSTGEGMLMAEAVGAVFYEEPWVIGLGIASKVPGTGGMMMDWTKIYINGAGERFTNEQTHYAIATNKLIEQDKTWVIVDSTEANQAIVDAVEAILPSEEAVKADTLEGLAEAMGVPVETFVATMNTYNAGAKAGKDALGKTKDFLVSMESAPYYAIKFYPNTMGTFAGVKTNENFQVLKTDGSVIGNLYAGGECANKILYNQVYMSGSAVQYALTSGRIAGAHAAQNLE